MRITFLNPQGNFDPQDSYWTQHPDFGGQLVYVKELALAMAGLGHCVDVVTRRIEAAIARDVADDRQSLPFVVCSSRLDWKKNHMGLVRAFVQSEPLQAAVNLASAAG